MIVRRIDGRIARAIIRHWLSQYRKSTCRHQTRTTLTLNLFTKPLAKVDDVLSGSRGYLLRCTRELNSSISVLFGTLLWRTDSQ